MFLRQGLSQARDCRLDHAQGNVGLGAGLNRFARSRFLSARRFSGLRLPSNPVTAQLLGMNSLIVRDAGTVRAPVGRGLRPECAFCYSSPTAAQAARYLAVQMSDSL